MSNNESSESKSDNQPDRRKRKNVRNKGNKKKKLKIKKDKTYINYNEQTNELCESYLSDVCFIIKNQRIIDKKFELAELALIIIADSNILYEDLSDWEKLYENICKNDWDYKIKHVLKKFYYQCKSLSYLLATKRRIKNITNNNVFESTISKEEFEKIKSDFKDYRPLYEKQINNKIYI